MITLNKTPKHLIIKSILILVLLLIVVAINRCSTADLEDELALLSREVSILKSQLSEKEQAELKDISSKISKLSSRAVTTDALQGDIAELRDRLDKLESSNDALEEQVKELKDRLDKLGDISEDIVDGWYKSSLEFSRRFINIETNEEFYKYTYSVHDDPSNKHYFEVKDGKLVNKGLIQGTKEPNNDDWKYIINITDINRGFIFNHSWINKIRRPDPGWTSQEFDETLLQSISDLYGGLDGTERILQASKAPKIQDFVITKIGRYNYKLVLSLIDKINVCTGTWESVTRPDGGTQEFFTPESCRDISFINEITFKSILLLNLPYETNQSFRSKGFWADPVYSKIELGNEDTYLKAFLADAERHGVDVSYVDVDLYI